MPSLTDRLSRLSLRGKLLALVTGITLVSVVALTIFNFRILRQSILHDTETMLQEKGEEVLRLASAELDANLDVLRAAALSPEVVGAVEAAEFERMVLTGGEVDALDQAWSDGAPAADSLVAAVGAHPLSAFLSRIQGEFPQQIETFVTDASGRTVAMTHRIGDFVQSDEEWWQQAAAGDVYVGTVEHDDATGRYAMNVAVPVRSDAGGIIGVLRGTVDVSAFMEQVAGVKTGETGYAVLLDAAGRYLYAPEADLLMQEASPEIRAFAEGDAASRSDLEDSGGAPALLSATPSSDDRIDWTLLLDQDLAEINEAVRASLLGSVTIGLVLLVLLGALGLWLARRLAAPVVALSSAAERVAGGDYDVAVEVQTQDEIGALATSFNAMVGQIRSAVAEAADQGRAAEQAAAEAERAQVQAEAAQASLEREVERAVAVMGAFADGDLTVHLDTDRDDAVADLFRAFNEAVAGLRGMIGEVHAAAADAAAASSAIGASTDELAASTQEQSAQAQEVAAAVEEMVRTILDTSRNASSTAEAASRNGAAARDGADAVAETVAKIREIADVVRGGATTVERLGASSEQIGQIVGTIEDIADQTNLLALNAAIEAARAGEHGRGFAVVADEVRKLAERTTTATAEIAQMIDQVRTEAVEAVGAMGRGGDAVEEGLALADRTGGALRGIVAGAEETESMISQIAAASEEQSVTSEQMAQGVESISAVSAESAHGLGRIAEAAGDLGRLTESLRALVGRFQTDGAAAPRPMPTGDGYAYDQALPPSISH